MGLLFTSSPGLLAVLLIWSCSCLQGQHTVCAWLASELIWKGRLEALGSSLGLAGSPLMSGYGWHGNSRQGTSTPGVLLTILIDRGGGRESRGRGRVLTALVQVLSTVLGLLS